VANRYDIYGRDREDAYHRGYFAGLLAGMRLAGGIARAILDRESLDRGTRQKLDNLLSLVSKEKPAKEDNENG